MEFTTTIYVGTPPQAIDNVMIDTGSNIAWFEDKNYCSIKSGAHCSIPPIYDHKNSSTYKKVMYKNKGTKVDNL
jgi:hypothetical protein